MVFDEASSSDRLVFSIRSEGDQRVGVWSGWLGGVHEIVYRFRVQTLAAPAPALPAGPLPEPPPEIREAYVAPTPSHPATHESVQQQLSITADAKKGEDVLDLACGTGLVSFPLAEAIGPDGLLVATDISQNMIDELEAVLTKSDG